MANITGLDAFEYDPRTAQFHYTSRLSWPMPRNDANPSHQALKRSTSPLSLQTGNQSYHHSTSHAPSAAMMRDWQMTQMTSQAQTQSYTLDPTPFPPQAYEPYGVPYQSSPADYMPPHPSLEASIDASISAGLQLDNPYLDLQSNINQMQANLTQLPDDMSQMPFLGSWQEFDGLAGYQTHGLPDMQATQQAFPVGSPNGSYLSESHLEVRSLSSSDNEWTTINHIRQHISAISNPEQTLHPRTFSDSSYSDVEQQSRNSGEYVDVPRFISSPSTDSVGDPDYYGDLSYYENERQSPPAVPTTTLVQTVPPTQSTTPPQAPTSPISRKQPRKTAPAKSTKAAPRRVSQVPKNDTEKRIGRRKGPLRPEQRRQACEIRKLGACLRCKFLKKTVSETVLLP